jgi:hypothetical protein
MFVIPKPGYSIPDPDLRDYLPPGGREVPESSFWHRCINDGDVSVGQPASTPQPKSKE